MKNENHEIILPDATAVIQSLRSIGYSIEAAIADIIDNSIDAKATIIKVDMIWTEEEVNYIRIEDNGFGMDENTLVQAMKIGSKNPLNNRENRILGRFGMGLKTASFSLGKRLTVKTKETSGSENVRCWDLDYIKDTNNWSLLKVPFNHESEELLGDIESDSGTIVLIEVLDRVIDQPYSRRKINKFYNSIRDVENHLSMVFHCFLEGVQKIDLFLNGNKVLPWDPYLSKELATQELPEERQRVGDDIITIQPFVLPHHTKITTGTFEEYAGPKGWLEQQGFYVYRNKRLLVAGSWLHLFSREEAYKLARIKVDITNKSDFNWQIDIKKSHAKPPQEIISLLKRVAEKVRERSHEVFYHRGTKSIVKKHNKTNIEHVWEQITRRNKTLFKLNRNHTLLKDLISSNKEIEDKLNYYLFHVEEYSPANIVRYNTFQIEKDEKLEKITIEDSQRMNMLVRMFLDLKYEKPDIIEQVLNYDTFKQYKKESIQDLIAKYLEEI
ncbi:hypothetical protein J2S74_000734 [Evansella vedderi]|uniref:ATP-binding protein n=1 Tax=Evansella vedderi TaxID=38282 RepID=A0ABT9ZRI4_9BACI|nr:ATP-binding protein [Evansella vedderi]MDQ0253362.1 hypothetical protein [Evansella vedderi]